MTASKTIGVTVFTAVFGAPACCIPPNGYVSFILRLSQIPLWCYKYNLSLFPVSA